MSTSYEVLIWTGFAFVAASIAGFWIFAFASEQRLRTLPRDLKTFADMKRAFRRGSKTKQIDRRRPSAIFAMGLFCKADADSAQREEIALLMREGISQLLGKTDNRAANNVRALLETLAAAAPSWEADFLEQ